MKRKSKKILIIVIVALIVALLLLFKTCSNKKEVETTKEPVVQEVIEEPITEATEEVVEETVSEETAKEEEAIKNNDGSYSYWVNFLNKDGSVLQRTAYKYGSTPEYKGNTPTYEDGSYYYSFKGWDKTISTVTGTQIYTALYDITGAIARSTPKVEDHYLTFTANTAGSTVKFSWISGTNVMYKASSSDTVLYGGSAASFDWEDYLEDTVITLSKVGDKVSFKGDNVVTGRIGYKFPLKKFYIVGSVSGSGDVTSLTNSVGGDVELTAGCYSNMFDDCTTSLTTAPDLPSTKLADNCYQFMFYNCNALTEAPDLPATDLCEGCYMHMFNDCDNLATAPALNATTLKAKCYYGMFTGCALTSAPYLPATTLAEDCYYQMFYNCNHLCVSNNSLHSGSKLIFTCQNLETNNDVAQMFTGTIGDWPGAGNDGTPATGTSYYCYPTNN